MKRTIGVPLMGRNFFDDKVKKKGDNEVVVMPGAKHGFAVRAVPDDGVQRGWADKAETQAIDWFTKYLA